jgi:tetratricopeptide (TPR) repeat protein
LSEKNQRIFRWRVVALILLLCSLHVFVAAAENPTQQQIERLKQRAQERPADFIALTMLGQAHLRSARESGDLAAYKEAASAFQAALTEFPEHIGALSGLASVRMALHRFSEARALAKHILQRDPRSSEGRLLLGDAQLALGEIGEATKIFRSLADSPAVFSRRSELARLRGDNDEALRLALRASDESAARGESPEDCAWYRVRAGEIFFRNGQLDLAEEHYSRALEQSPQSYQAAEHIAELRAAQERFHEAIDAYQKLLARTSRPDLQQELGDLFLFLHKPEQAKPWQEKALAQYLASAQRGEVHFLHHLAGFYADSREDGAAAVQWARKDLALRSTSFTHDALAWALYRAGRFTESRREVETALAGGIKDAHICYHAGLIFSAAGELARGQEFLRETARLNPRHNGFHVHR